MFPFEICYLNATFMETAEEIKGEKMKKLSLSLFLLLFFDCISRIAELIYKEVLDWEERTKNGVIRGQPASIG